MAWHHLLLKWHPMIGCDRHFELTLTWPPLPAPDIWHLVGQRLAGFGGATMTGDDVLANNWNIIMRDSDIQYGIPHIPLPPYPPCVLALLYTGLSGSKSYFGPASVQANGGSPIAAALLVYVNPQLNCNDLPAPTGLAATWSNVVCGMTWGDIIGGFLSAIFDVLITWILNEIGGKIAGRLTPKGAAEWVVEVIKVTTNTVLQQFTGSPVGYTYGVPSHLIDWAFGDGAGKYANPGNWGTMIGHPLGEWIGRVSGLDQQPSSIPTTAASSSLANDSLVEQF